eukprot:TRINITY_DN5110_c0_g1_i5.p2 TRINITY_DN5110_c0_g1~~TRINITY_DN5110_c0_g1_i5.p2  ORF type:complete len:245 (-),score=-10.38 TRINITY_DN5110_c0_g1_i5:1533-2267(-)
MQQNSLGVHIYIQIVQVQFVTTFYQIIIFFCSLSYMVKDMFFVLYDVSWEIFQILNTYDWKGDRPMYVKIKIKAQFVVIVTQYFTATISHARNSRIALQNLQCFYSVIKMLSTGRYSGQLKIYNISLKQNQFCVDNNFVQINMFCFTNFLKKYYLGLTSLINQLLYCVFVTLQNFQYFQCSHQTHREFLHTCVLGIIIQWKQRTQLSDGRCEHILAIQALNASRICTRMRIGYNNIVEIKNIVI